MRELATYLLWPLSAGDAPIPAPDHSVANTLIVTGGVVFTALTAYLSTRVRRSPGNSTTGASTLDEAERRERVYVSSLEADRENLRLLRDAVRHRGGDPYDWQEDERTRQAGTGTPPGTPPGAAGGGAGPS